MNAHDSIVDAILAALRQAPSVTTGPIDEELDAERIPEGVAQAISVSMVSSTPDDAQLISQPLDWESTVVIECYVRADVRAPVVGRASRALHAAVHARLMQDPTLMGAALYIGQPHIEIDRERTDTRAGCCIGTYRIQHRTPSTTLDV